MQEDVGEISGEGARGGEREREGGRGRKEGREECSVARVYGGGEQSGWR